MNDAIVIPFKGHPSVIQSCLSVLCPLTPRSTRIVVVDDGGNLPPLVAFPDVTILRHPETRGPAAARNTGLLWCRQNHIDVAILLDADCSASEGFVEAHLRLHKTHPDVFCIGGAISGSGSGAWAYLDRVMSWFTSMENSPEHLVYPPLHLPTTNMSMKVTGRFAPLAVFNEHLRTGEDIAYVNGLRKAGEQLLFSPEPKITHHDRTTFRGFLRHQYRWGLHTYVVRYGQDALSPRKRMFFAIGFLAASPLYAAYATWLNMRPWLRGHRKDACLIPVVYLCYLFKAVAVLHGAIRPSAALFPNRNR